MNAKERECWRGRVYEYVFESDDEVVVEDMAKDLGISTALAYQMIDDLIESGYFEVDDE